MAAQDAAVAGIPAPGVVGGDMSREDQTLLLFARLMEGGQEDDETCRELDQLTKLLTDDLEAVKQGKSSICEVIDGDCLDTAVCYLDMRQPEVVRGHAILAMSAYLKAAGEEGRKTVSEFFYARVNRGTYDDYIVAFCVASAMFPIMSDLSKELFLSEGFISSLGPLMRRKWKSKKVETACLEMLNAACLDSECRAAVQKYCVEWLEEIVDQDPEEVSRSFHASEPDTSHPGSVSMRKHSEQVQNMAAVILTKLKATQPPQSATEITGERVQQATTSVEHLSKMFTRVLLKDPEAGRQNAVEGLAYASLQPKVKESLSQDAPFLTALVRTLKEAPPKSPLTYGALSIIANLTRYRPVLSEEDKRIAQLKAYANAAGKLPSTPDPLEDDGHVGGRNTRVFEAGVMPVLVSRSKSGSVASLSLIVQVVHSISVTSKLRGPLAQQGAIPLLIGAWTALSAAAPPPAPATAFTPGATDPTAAARRTAAQALARILISTDPALVFGGTRAVPQSAAIRPLASIVAPSQDTDTRDLLPSFEALMALTNLASTDDAETRAAIVRAAFADTEELLLSSNARVQRAAAELICNLAQCPEGAALFADGSRRAATRLHVLLALADAEDEGTRAAAGGALANLSAHESVVRAVVAREKGVRLLLALCADDSDDLRQRGGFALLNLAATPGEAGELAREKIKAENGAEILTECAKKTRRPEVLEIAVAALKALHGVE